jgi:hypothetical protein
VTTAILRAAMHEGIGSTVPQGGTVRFFLNAAKTKSTQAEESAWQLGFALCSARLQADICLNLQCPDRVGTLQKHSTYGFSHNL